MPMGLADFLKQHIAAVKRNADKSDADGTAADNAASDPGNNPPPPPSAPSDPVFGGGERTSHAVRDPIGVRDPIVAEREKVMSQRKYNTPPKIAPQSKLKPPFGPVRNQKMVNVSLDTLRTTVGRLSQPPPQVPKTPAPSRARSKFRGHVQLRPVDDDQRPGGGTDRITAAPSYTRALRLAHVVSLVIFLAQAIFLVIVLIIFSDDDAMEYANLPKAFEVLESKTWIRRPITLRRLACDSTVNGSACVMPVTMHLEEYQIGEIWLPPVIAASFLFAIAIHIHALATIKSYMRNLERGRLAFWVQHTVSTSTYSVAVASILGIQDVASLILVVTMCVAHSSLGLSMELCNQQYVVDEFKGSKKIGAIPQETETETKRVVTWAPHLASCIAFAGLLGAIGAHLFNRPLPLENGLPVMVEMSYFILALYLAVGVVLSTLHHWGAAPLVRRGQLEMASIINAVVFSSALAWLIIFTSVERS